MSFRKYVCVEKNRSSLIYLLQVDKSVNLEELDDDDFREFINEQYYEDIHDHSIEIRETTYNQHYKHLGNYKPEWFLYKSGDGFTFGKVVPPNTKSIIDYNPNYRDENDELKTGGKIIGKPLEVFLSSTKEETIELWNKGDMKTLTNYFITNTWEHYSFPPKQYEPDDTGTLQLIYDEKDNPVEIHLVDVGSYQKDEGWSELLK